MALDTLANVKTRLGITGTADDSLPWCTHGVSELRLTTTSAAELLSNAMASAELTATLAA